MFKKICKNIAIFFGLLLCSVLFLIITAIPQIISIWTEFLWGELIPDVEMCSQLIILLLGLSVLVIIFLLCVKMINKAVRNLKDSECQEFIELDRSSKGCVTVIYGYHVPIATINSFYSDKGRIDRLVRKQGIDPLLVRRKQLTYRLELFGDFITCIVALLLSLVTAYITSEEMQFFYSFDMIFTVVIIGICVSSIFLRPVVARVFQSKYDDDITRYELQKLDQFLLDYNQKLDLQNIDHCGKKEQQSRIKKLQKELVTTKSSLKKKKIKKDIKALENGVEIPRKKRAVSKKKNRNKHK